MPILLTKRILARYAASYHTVLVVALPCQEVGTLGELPAPSPLVRKRKNVTFETGCKRQRLSEHGNAASVVEQKDVPSWACMGSEYVKLLEYQWDASAAMCAASAAQRAAAQAQAKLLHYEKTLYENAIQNAKAALEAKDEQLRAIMLKDEQAKVDFDISFVEAQLISNGLTQLRMQSGDQDVQVAETSHGKDGEELFPLSRVTSGGGCGFTVGV